MSSEINQVVACDDSSELQVVGIKDSVTISSPHFDLDDSMFTELSVNDKECRFREVTESPESGSPFVVKFNDQGGLEFIQVFGVKVPSLDIKNVFTEGEVTLIERKDGTVVRVFSSDFSEDLVARVVSGVRSIMEGNTLSVVNSRWGAINE